MSQVMPYKSQQGAFTPPSAGTITRAAVNRGLARIDRQTDLELAAQNAVADLLSNRIRNSGGLIREAVCEIEATHHVASRICTTNEAYADACRIVSQASIDIGRVIGAYVRGS